MYNNAYLQNVVHYDSNDNFLSVIRHDVLYAAFILTQFDSIKNNKTLFKIKNLSMLPEDLNLINDHLDGLVIIDKQKYTYGICLFNKWCGFKNIIVNETINKNKVQLISQLIYENCNKDSKLFYDTLHDLNKKLMFFISITKHVPSIDVNEMLLMVDEDTNNLIKKIPNNHGYLSFYINEALINKTIDNFPKDSNLYKLYRSGSRFSKSQLARSCVNIGLVADENNIVIQTPINSSLIFGLTAEEFFAGASGTKTSACQKT